MTSEAIAAAASAMSRITGSPVAAATDPSSFSIGAGAADRASQTVIEFEDALNYAELGEEICLLIDARKKAGYPEELFCDPETAVQVDRRWREYFPSGDVEMGDSDVGHLDL